MAKLWCAGHLGGVVNKLMIGVGNVELIKSQVSFTSLKINIQPPLAFLVCKIVEDEK